jgi:protein involved in polysaccharide export with SLBB domain
VARVVREEDGNARILPLDLSALVSGGRIPPFAFSDGDVLVVPSTEAGSTPVFASSGVQVFGAVAAPTVVAITKPRPLLEVLMLAGSPLADAKLEEIWLVHPVEGRFDSRLIDLTLFMQQGNPIGNPLVFPGDALQITYQEDSWIRRNAPLILGALTATATVWLAFDQISGE